MKSQVLTIDVQPSDQLFAELGNNTYDYKDLLSELVDNAIAARHENQILEVTIEVYTNSDGKPVEFIVRDNAKGIPQDRLGQAISPAAIRSKDSLNEHGLGMKQAVAGLGKLKYLVTKTVEDEKGRLIKEFRFGTIPVHESEFPQSSGTEIAITDLRAVVSTNPTNYTRTIVPYLGARYRRFLKPSAKILNLLVSIRNADKPSQISYQWSVEEVKPTYFHPSTRQNAPVILRFPIKGEGWAAELTLGYAPTNREEYEELGLQEPNKFHPYRASLSTQGLDVIFQNRVVLFHQLSELGIVEIRHNDYNDIRGEVDLKYGFSTAITKNTIIHDAHFELCIAQVRDVLRGKVPGPGGKSKDYIIRKTYPEEIPERLLRDRLIEWLKNNPVNRRNDVKSEYVVEGIEGFIDILADKEAWEMKPDQASAYDVYQLFMYMDVGQIAKGFLVAKSFTTGAQVAAQHIRNTHDKEIVLAPRDQFPINHPPTEWERTGYY